LTLHQSKQSLAEVQYWAEQRVDRLDFVREILRRLDLQGWPNKSDVGWSDYDVEIYGNRWSTLQLTTVAEEHPPAKQLLRCRLQTRWSLPATVAFWTLCGAELLVLGIAGSWLRWWIWVMLLTPVPLFVWVLRHQQRELQSMILVFLDEVAKHSNMTKVRPQPSRAERQPPPVKVERSPFAEVANSKFEVPKN